MGLAGANSIHACLWCKVHRDDRYDMTKAIDYYEQASLKRTFDDIVKCSVSKSYSVKAMPLLQIDLEDIIIDELHLLLRITDRLTMNLINLMLQQDKRKVFKGSTCSTFTQPFLKKLEQCINSCGITFKIFEKMNADGSGSGHYDYTTLTGNDKKKLLSCLPSQFHEFVSDPNISERVARLWKEFEDLYNYLSSCNISSSDFFAKATNWVTHYLALGGIAPGFEKRSITPYMHCMVYHIPQFIARHGSIKKFSGQLVEKTNDKLRKVHNLKSSYFDSSYEAMTSIKRQQLLSYTARVCGTKRNVSSSHSTTTRKRPKTVGVEIREDTKEILARKAEIMSYSSAELKSRLAAHGVITRFKAHAKLVQLLLECDSETC